jgi:hypothetical protein
MRIVSVVRPRSGQKNNHLASLQGGSWVTARFAGGIQLLCRIGAAAPEVFLF